MKQILIITRINSDKRNDEFIEIFPSEKEPIERRNIEQNVRLGIHNGINFYDKNILPIAEKIKELISPNAEEVLIVIHYTGNFKNLRNALNSIQNDGNWQIQNYSGENNNYGEIKRAFQGAVTNSSDIELIYKLFSSDHLLEAKLNLLHNCIIPENIPSEKELSELLLDFSDSFKTFKETVSKIKESIGRENNEKTQMERLSWNNKEYVKALTKLRISLLGS